jgi:phosphomannomutase
MRSIENAFDFHKQRIWDHIDKDAIRKAGFKVAIDCCNGAGAFFSRGFLEELGCEVVSIFDEKDGIFRRKPEPVPENIHELGRCVRENACDIGFAQDPDADRIVAVDSKGQPIGEQYSIVLAAEHVLSKTPGNVVVNVQTTKALEDLARKRGCEVFYSRVGEINVTDMMAAKQAVIGGEGGSGGVIWPLVHPCRDSFTGMALILEMMALRSASIEDILNSIPRYFTSNVKVKCSAEAALDLIRTLRKEYADLRLTTVDGLRIDWEDAWILIRPSNTEPVLRISSEALSQGKADNLTEEFAAKVKAYLA